MKNKNSIECRELYDEIERYWEVDTEGRVWPCCHYLTLWVQSQSSVDFGRDEYQKQFYSDKTVAKYFKENPNWNNLTKYPVDQIFEHEFFTTYVNHHGWNSDSPPKLCEKICKI
jgi:hypothetical protein